MAAPTQRRNLFPSSARAQPNLLYVQTRRGDMLYDVREAHAVGFPPFGVDGARIKWLDFHNGDSWREEGCHCTIYRLRWLNRQPTQPRQKGSPIMSPGRMLDDFRVNAVALHAPIKIEDAHAFGVSIESLPISRSNGIGTCECLGRDDVRVSRRREPKRGSRQTTETYPFDRPCTKCARRIFYTPVL